MLSALGDWLFNASELTPHGFCLLWDPALIWTYAISDTVIALAYFSIPVALVIVAQRRRDLIFRPVLWLFAAFILLCGTTHWLDLATLWVPLYDLQAVVKGLTALVSMGTALAVWYYLPNLLALPSSEQLRTANAELLASREQLAQSQKMDAVGQLTGGIAHDFNNLLQVISGSLALMERRIRDGRVEQAAKYIGAIKQASETAARLTNRLLAFSRRQTLQPQSTDIDRLVDTMDELLRRSLGPAIVLQVKPRDGQWYALCDPAQLESAILNLSINARDAMPEGGSLTITTYDRMLSSEDVAADEAAPGAYVELSVKDTGIGMDREVLGRVFEPFFTTKPAGEGTGLGLSQVYGFVKQSGGFVRIESTPGEGTQVRIFLPGHEKRLVPKEAISPPPAEAGSEAGDRRGASILMVEDRDDVRVQVSESLRDCGYTVIEARGSMEALALIDTHRVDLLLSDIGLPELDGRRLAEKIRERFPELPVLLITGYAGMAADGLNVSDGLEILRKPFSLDELLEQVQRLLAKTVTSDARPVTKVD